MSKRIMSITGRLGSDPELKTTEKGNRYYQFRMANKVFNDPDDFTFWFTVNVWEGSRCFNMTEKLKKGSAIEVIGDYSDRLWTNTKTNEIKIGRDITAVAIYYIESSKKDNNKLQEAPPTDGIPVVTTTVNESHKVAEPTAETGTLPNSNQIDDDLPF